MNKYICYKQNNIERFETVQSEVAPPLPDSTQLGYGSNPNIDQISNLAVYVGTSLVPISTQPNLSIIAASCPNETLLVGSAVYKVIDNDMPAGDGSHGMNVGCYFIPYLLQNYNKYLNEGSDDYTNLGDAYFAIPYISYTGDYPTETNNGTNLPIQPGIPPTNVPLPVSTRPAMTPNATLVAKIPDDYFITYLEGESSYSRITDFGTYVGTSLQSITIYPNVKNDGNLKCENATLSIGSAVYMANSDFMGDVNGTIDGNTQYILNKGTYFIPAWCSGQIIAIPYISYDGNYPTNTSSGTNLPILPAPPTLPPPLNSILVSKMPSGVFVSYLSYYHGTNIDFAGIYVGTSLQSITTAPNLNNNNEIKYSNVSLSIGSAVYESRMNMTGFNSYVLNKGTYFIPIFCAECNCYIAIPYIDYDGSSSYPLNTNTLTNLPIQWKDGITPIATLKPTIPVITTPVITTLPTLKPTTPITTLPTLKPTTPVVITTKPITQIPTLQTIVSSEYIKGISNLYIFIGIGSVIIIIILLILMTRSSSNKKI